MKRRGWDWIGHGAVGVLLVSGGITIGTCFGPAAPAAPATVRGSGSASVERSASKPTEEPVGSGEDPSHGRATADGIPPAPGFESFAAGEPAPPFAGEYVVLRGAETDPPQRAWTPPPAVEASPAVGPGSSAAADGGATGERPVERARPSPAQGIPRGAALRIPLLGVSRPGGRVVLYDLGVHGGPVPAGIEGEWGVIGRCERRVRVEFGLATHRAGELRAIGRAEGSSWGAEPLVPRQACEAGGERFTRPRTPSGPERASFGAFGAEAGFSPEDLRELARVGSAALLVFRNEAGNAAVIAVTTGSTGIAATWSQFARAGEGGLWLLGVYRMGSGAEAWMISGSRDAPRTLVTRSSTDLRSWSEAESAPLHAP